MDPSGTARASWGALRNQSLQEATWLAPHYHSRHASYPAPLPEGSQPATPKPQTFSLAPAFLILIPAFLSPDLSQPSPLSLVLAYGPAPGCSLHCLHPAGICFSNWNTLVWAGASGVGADSYQIGLSSPRDKAWCRAGISELGRITAPVKVAYLEATERQKL